MTNRLKTLLADADALTEDAKRLRALADDLLGKRMEIIDGLVTLGIKVTEARAMLAKIDCTVTFPETGEAEPASQQAAE